MVATSGDDVVGAVVMLRGGAGEPLPEAGDFLHLAAVACLTEVAVEEARRAVKAGAKAGLVYPSHGWLRFGYQKGAPQDKYRKVYETSGLPLILFQYPDATKCTYDLQTQLEIGAQEGVFAMKNGVSQVFRSSS